MKRNIKVFNYSFILRTIGLGMFNTLFNIYILENSNFSNAFLEKFHCNWQFFNGSIKLFYRFYN